MKLKNQILRRPCRSAGFDDINRNLWLAQEMLQFMKNNRAIGLAANQVGINVRLFVMQVGERTRYCFNPIMMDKRYDMLVMDEQCLSFPGKQCTIVRPDEIEVRYQNHRGEWIQDRLQGLESRCYQHELDHLNGITMWDRQKEQNAEQS